MHTTSRSVVAAARAHPAGVAAPSAVIATAIVLLTFVTTVIVPSLPPGLFGAGSAPAIQPGPSQQRHRVLPQHPVPTGECRHQYESARHDPGDLLRHLLRMRDGKCGFPACSRS